MSQQVEHSVAHMAVAALWTVQFWSVLDVHWKDWCWSWNSSTLATWCEELTHWKRLWCWEGLGAGGEGDHRGWDSWMASPTRWTWVWVNSRSWWWTGRPGMLQFMGLQRVGHDWATELNWAEASQHQFEHVPTHPLLPTDRILSPHRDSLVSLRNTSACPKSSVFSPPAQ